MENQCLVATEFQSEKIKKFWRWTVVMNVQQCAVLNATKLHTYKWLKWDILCQVYFITIKKMKVKKCKNKEVFV